MRHIAVYVRVSTRKQDTKSQEPDLDQWLTAYAGNTPVVWYRDKASGRTMSRKGWERLQSAMDAGKVESLVCWRLDRLGRTASGLTTLFDALTRRKINLVSVKDGIDLETPAGRLIANVLASVAAYESEVISERICAGQAASKKTWGGSKKGRRVSVTQEQLETIKRLQAEGKGVTAIARATGLSRTTVYRLEEAA